MNIHVVRLVNFQAQLNYASTLNAREVMKFHNPDGQSFETEFKMQVGQEVQLVIRALINCNTCPMTGQSQFER